MLKPCTFILFRRSNFQQMLNNFVNSPQTFQPGVYLKSFDLNKKGKMTYRDSALYRSWIVTSLIFTISPPRFFISFSGPSGSVAPATICRDFSSIDEKQWAEVKICFSLIIEPEQCNFVRSSFTIETVHGSCKNTLITYTI